MTIVVEFVGTTPIVGFGSGAYQLWSYSVTPGTADDLPIGIQEQAQPWGCGRRPEAAGA
jgi:hypothetical protein